MLSLTHSDLILAVSISDAGAVCENCRLYIDLLWVPNLIFGQSLHFISFFFTVINTVVFPTPILPFSAEVKESVQPHIYSFPAPSCAALGRTFNYFAFFFFFLQ
jgi:hypothetical protein